MIKIKIENSMVINLPTEEIFAYMSDVEKLAEWSSAVISSKKTSPGEMHVGTTIQSTIRFLGRWLDMTYEIVECEPGHQLTFKSIAGVAPSFFCYRFEPSEGGGTIVSQEAIINCTGKIVGLAEPVVINTVRRQIEHDLLILKDLLEARAAMRSSPG